MNTDAKQTGEKVHYFGTNLTSAGHYFWQLGKGMHRSDVYFDKIPFNPEEMPRRDKSENTIRKGDVRFYWEGGYTICAIEGSCIDKRWGTKSVFFVERKLSQEEMIELLKSNEVASMIINAMPFAVEHFKPTQP